MISNNMEKFSKAELKSEKWKDIEGYDGMYQVSDLGRVRSKKYGRWKVLKAKKRRDGYLIVSLCKDGKPQTAYIHRLVAQAFIKNDDETKTLINHIDECKQNNRMGNLEYCTASYNLSYNGLRYRRPYPQAKRDKLKPLYRPDLSIKQNIELFRANGVECCRDTVWKLRKDLGLIKNNSTK